MVTIPSDPYFIRRALDGLVNAAMTVGDRSWVKGYFDEQTAAVDTALSNLEPRYPGDRVPEDLRSRFGAIVDNFWTKRTIQRGGFYLLGERVLSPDGQEVLVVQDGFQGAFSKERLRFVTVVNPHFERDKLDNLSLHSTTYDCEPSNMVTPEVIYSGPVRECSPLFERAAQFMWEETRAA